MGRVISGTGGTFRGSGPGPQLASEAHRHSPLLPETSANALGKARIAFRAGSCGRPRPTADTRALLVVVVGKSAAARRSTRWCISLRPLCSCRLRLQLQLIDSSVAVHGSVTQTPITTLPVDEYRIHSNRNHDHCSSGTSPGRQGPLPSQSESAHQETTTNGICAAKAVDSKDKNPEEH